MYKINRMVDRAIKELCKKYPRPGIPIMYFYKLYLASALFEPLPKNLLNHHVDPDGFIDNEEVVLPFNSMIFNLEFVKDQLTPDCDELYCMLVKPTNSKDLELFIMGFKGKQGMYIGIECNMFVDGNTIRWEADTYPILINSFNNFKKWKQVEANCDESKRYEKHSVFDLISTICTYLMVYLSTINDRNLFIIENQQSFNLPNTSRKKQKSIRVTYSINSPREIKKHYNHMSVGTGNGTPLKIGQERRAHWRYFKSDRFINMKGKRTRIQAYWAGPSSFTDPKDPRKKYIVRLDL